MNISNWVISTSNIASRSSVVFYLKISVFALHLLTGYGLSNLCYQIYCTKWKNNGNNITGTKCTKNTNKRVCKMHKALIDEWFWIFVSVLLVRKTATYGQTGNRIRPACQIWQNCLSGPRVICQRVLDHEWVPWPMAVTARLEQGAHSTGKGWFPLYW